MSDEKYRVKWMIKDSDELSAVFDDQPNFSVNYIKEASPKASSVIKGGAFFCEDFSSKFVLCQGGHRRTEDVPDTYENRIYVLGNSVTYGEMCHDGETIPSQLQKICNEKISLNKYAVVNCGVLGVPLEFTILQLKTLPLNPGDIVVHIFLQRRYYKKKDDVWRWLKLEHDFCHEKEVKYAVFLYPKLLNITGASKFELKLASNSYRDLLLGNISAKLHTPPTKYFPPPLLNELNSFGCPCFDLQPLFNRPHPYGELMVDKGHVGPKGNALIANNIYNSFIEKLFYEITDKKTILQLTYHAFSEFVRIKYMANVNFSGWLNSIERFETKNFETIGSIVMNCNPFTLGHLHIITKALTIVDYLYIFVVREDRSEFKFEDRFLMVKDGTTHFADRVRVIPSGEFIISSITFPEYFEKAKLTEKRIDCSQDIILFATAIAPHLNIKYRFVGDEPYCNVTNQYNFTMQQELPKFGIEVIELPRFEKNGEAISASKVRQYISERKLDKLKNLIPKSTFVHLIRMGICPKPYLDD